MIPQQDWREWQLLSSIPTGTPPRRKFPFAQVWYGLFKAIEVAICLTGFTIVAAFFVIAFVIFWISGLWWASLLMAVYFGGDLIQYMQEHK